MANVELTKPDLLIGAHQSIAGGTPRAVERGVSAGCRVRENLATLRRLASPSPPGRGKG